MEEDSTLNASELLIRIHMGERKKSTNANPVRAANIKENMNEWLTAIHQEVNSNIDSVHGALLRMNRSIQAERTFGILKRDKLYKRLLWFQPL